VNYLVISDLHVQEVERSPTGRLFYFDDEFDDFLAYYRDGRRWKLFINGDFIEFYHIPVRPEPGEKLLQGVTLYPTDLRFFPGTEWQKSVWKLDVTLRGHPEMLRALADFLAAGNEITLLRGNHDIEFCWPQVQEHFRLLIAQRHPEEVSFEAMQAIVHQRIRFFPWFYLEPGFIYVEHGHQYDAYCSNAHNLHPVLPGNNGRVELSISALSMRYFGSRINVIDPIAMENVNSIPHYLWRLVRSNPVQTLKFPLYYFEMVYRILTKITRPHPRLDAAVAAVEAEVRQEVQKSFDVDHETLRRLQALAHPPVIRRWWPCVSCTLIDLVLASVVGIVGWVVLATTAGGLGGWPTGALAVLMMTCVLVGRHRLGKMNDHRNLRDIARHVRDLLNVRYVVFGHSHDPDVVALSPDGEQAYFNVGTWIPRSGEGQFVYLEIDLDSGRPVARLMRWDRQGRRPAEVTTARTEKGGRLRKWKRALSRVRARAS
jgi:UDP-2,3-diacylglucosamine pyrophosphatase LpxH